MIDYKFKIGLIVVVVDNAAASAAMKCNHNLETSLDAGMRIWYSMVLIDAGNADVCANANAFWDFSRTGRVQRGCTTRRKGGA